MKSLAAAALVLPAAPWARAGWWADVVPLPGGYAVNDATTIRHAYGVTFDFDRATVRPEAVRAWLAAHGVAAARLRARGYGKTQPAVENSSDQARARNRRVELACVR